MHAPYVPPKPLPRVMAAPKPRPPRPVLVQRARPQDAAWIVSAKDEALRRDLWRWNHCISGRERRAIGSFAEFQKQQTLKAA